MNIPFTKMHGCGNDYIYINGFDINIQNPEELSKVVSDRRFGIGSDGLVLICPSTSADAKMRMFNIDGSEGKMCGNAIRCVAKYVYDRNIVRKETITIETLSGIKIIKLKVVEGEVQLATVDMGTPILEPKEIPIITEAKDILVNYPISIEGNTYYITPVSMGNPHCVLFHEDIYSIDLPTIGPSFEYNSIFPEGVNTEFIQLESKTVLHMRVWERGSGETWACGTGACAAVVAAVLNGYCDKNTDVTVKLKGGDLLIRYTDESVYMTGPATLVFDGTFTWSSK